MEAAFKRNIDPGTQFKGYFPASEKSTSVILKQATVDDTMDLIPQIVRDTTQDTKKIAPELKGKNLRDTCKNVWSFIYNHIQYTKDKEGVEQVRRPSRSWADRKHGVDCDCYTVFISSILTNLKIPHALRIAAYNGNDYYQHVYVVVPEKGNFDNLENRLSYYVIDPVLDEFDKEAPFTKKKDYPMKLERLDGPGEQQSNIVKTYVSRAGDIIGISSDNRFFKWKPDTNLNGLGKWQPLSNNLNGNGLGWRPWNDITGESFDETIKNTTNELKDIAEDVGTEVENAQNEIEQIIDDPSLIDDKFNALAENIGDKGGQIIRKVNRFANPATILLRNGFLLSMKINLMKVASKIKFGFLSKEEAMNEHSLTEDSWEKAKRGLDRALTLYWQAGGRKDNLKRAIINGKGNQDNRVTLSDAGLSGFNGDEDEFKILAGIHDDQTLGEAVSASAAIAAASTAVASIAAVVGQIHTANKQEDIEQEKTERQQDALETQKELEKLKSQKNQDNGNGDISQAGMGMWLPVIAGSAVVGYVIYNKKKKSRRLQASRQYKKRQK